MLKILKACYLSHRSNAQQASNVGQPKPDFNLVDLDMYFFGDGPMGRGEKGMHTTPSEDWVAEIHSPPYLFVDGNRRARIQNIAPVQPVKYKSQAEIGGQIYYLIHSGDSFEAKLQDLPTGCSNDAHRSLVLIKLPSATHGWQNGQHFYNLQLSAKSPDVIQFTAPNIDAANLPPAYYMMFCVDCHGKPSVERMVRFDNSATAP